MANNLGLVGLGGHGGAIVTGGYGGGILAGGHGLVGVAAPALVAAPVVAAKAAVDYYVSKFFI